MHFVEDTVMGQYMAENSLRYCTGGTCWKSESRVPGKAVHKEVSHWRYFMTQPPKGGAGEAAGC